MGGYTIGFTGSGPVDEPDIDIAKIFTKIVIKHNKSVLNNFRLDSLGVFLHDGWFRSYTLFSVESSTVLACKVPW